MRKVYLRTLIFKSALTYYLYFWWHSPGQVEPASPMRGTPGSSVLPELIRDSRSVLSPPFAAEDAWFRGRFQAFFGSRKRLNIAQVSGDSYFEI